MEEPWTAIEQLTHNSKHRLLPIVRLQGHDPHRDLYRHSQWHYTHTRSSTTATLLPDYLAAEHATSNQLLQHAFWRRHLPEYAANTYCKYLTLELKHTRNKQEDIELDKCTEELSFLFQNPCMHLPVRPLHDEVALTATGIAQYVPSRQDLTPFRTPHLCQSLAGNSLSQAHHCHPWRRLPHQEPHKRCLTRAQHRQLESAPTQVQEHFATKILAPLTENLNNTKKLLLEMWKTNEERLRTLNPYRHLKLPPRSNGQQPPQPPQDVTPIQYGHPDDHEQLYRQAIRRSEAEEAHANRQLVPGVLAPCVLDHLIMTHSHDLLHALRATRFHNTDKVGLIKKLIGDNIQPMIQDIPGMQAPEQITSLVSALQWWAAQPPETVTTPPPATATVTAVQWARPAQQHKTPNELPAEIPIIVLARKSHHSGPGPKLHQNITNLIPLRSAPASDGAPVLPQAKKHTQLWRTDTGCTPPERRATAWQGTQNTSWRRAVARRQRLA